MNSQKLGQRAQNLCKPKAEQIPHTGKEADSVLPLAMELLVTVS